MSSQLRTYSIKDAIVFNRINDAWGRFSNFYPNPIIVNDLLFRTSEALYQALKFYDPEIQAEIAAAKKPADAKQIAWSHTPREDLDEVRHQLMRYVLQVKWHQHWNELSQLLLRTKDKPIVELSCKDDYWGAKPSEDGSTLSGCNVLGRLLMELRQQISSGERTCLTLPQCKALIKVNGMKPYEEPSPEEQLALTGTWDD